MKNLLKGSLVIVMLAAGLSLSAQERLRMHVGYSVNQPTGGFKDLVSNTSYRGFTADALYDINTKFAAGLGVSYSDFYQKYPRQVYQTGEGAISAVLTNSIQVLPIVARANYNLTTEGFARPYVGVGAGMNLINYEQYLGEFPNGKTAIRPAVTGEAGIRIPIGYSKQSGLNIGAHYNYLPFNYAGIKSLNSWGGHIGIFFPLR